MEKGLPRIRTRVELPQQLRDRESTLVAEALLLECQKNEGDRFYSQQVNHFHDRVQKYCTHYKVDALDPLQVLCDSGSCGRVPYRGRSCADCRFSQVALRADNTFFYTGEQPTVEDSLVQDVILR